MAAAFFANLFAKSTNSPSVAKLKPSSVKKVVVSINAKELKDTFKQKVHKNDGIFSFALGMDDLIQEAVEAAVDEFHFPLDCPNCKRMLQETVGSLRRKEEVLCICQKTLFVIQILN